MLQSETPEKLFTEELNRKTAVGCRSAKCTACLEKMECWVEFGASHDKEDIDLLKDVQRIANKAGKGTRKQDVQGVAEGTGALQSGGEEVKGEP